MKPRPPKRTTGGGERNSLSDKIELSEKGKVNDLTQRKGSPGGSYGVYVINTTTLWFSGPKITTKMVNGSLRSVQGVGETWSQRSRHFVPIIMRRGG